MIRSMSMAEYPTPTKMQKIMGPVVAYRTVPFSPKGIREIE
jgi:hypothetical protein